MDVKQVTWIESGEGDRSMVSQQYVVWLSSRQENQSAVLQVENKTKPNPLSSDYVMKDDPQLLLLLLRPGSRINREQLSVNMVAAATVKSRRRRLIPVSHTTRSDYSEVH